MQGKISSLTYKRHICSNRVYFSNVLCVAKVDLSGTFVYMGALCSSSLPLFTIHFCIRMGGPVVLQSKAE